MASFELSGACLKVSGILDGEAEVPLRAKLQELTESGEKSLELDLTAVESITSICIGALVAFWIDLSEAGGKLKFSSSDQVKRVLDMTGLTSVLMKDG